MTGIGARPAARAAQQLRQPASLATAADPRYRARMCRRVTCSICGKPTFAGCGAHVEQVLAGVPKAQRCKCTAEDKAKARPWWKIW